MWLLGDPDGNVASELVVPAAGHVGLTWTKAIGPMVACTLQPRFLPQR